MREVIRSSFNEAANKYDQFSVLQTEVGRRLLERLEWVRLTPARVMDVGTGTGCMLPGLAERYPDAQLMAVDLADEMLRVAKRRAGEDVFYVCADALALSIAEGSFDLLCSNLMLQWCAPLHDALMEMARVLVPEGLLMFSTFGPDTLKEYKAAWEEVDRYVHVNDFVDMHDVGDALMGAGFSDPVMDVEYITITYDTVADIARDLQGIGSIPLQQTPDGLMGKGRWHAFCKAYESFRDAEGRFPLTYEVVYGHAWKGKPQQRTEKGDIHVSIDSIHRKK